MFGHPIITVFLKQHFMILLYTVVVLYCTINEPGLMVRMVQSCVRVPARADLRCTVQTISSGDRPDSEEVTHQTFPTTVGGLIGLNRLGKCELR